ncbi:hypothetical protein TH63_09450 [Rufibacter radiotolerans]|uniref:Response regulatory domain-containing protein n=1 Tax=Rufibacter radiotolerans TaxID=1379910 RepID=A0A0H4VPE7_9BACT|nr:response regulator [Rufibacter radiotolerans]AKQ45817.1 hypothetical protein TH63_09450 [Rufibacter radiotolerans]
MKKFDLVMVVEDDPTATFVAHRILERSALAERLCTARNGKQALTFVQDHFCSPDPAPGLPSVILVDISMPVMDGFEFLREVNLLGLARRPLIAMLSSSRKEEDVRKSFQLKADAYFTKPFRIEYLEQLLVEAP